MSGQCSGDSLGKKEPAYKNRRLMHTNAYLVHCFLISEAKDNEPTWYSVNWQSWQLQLVFCSFRSAERRSVEWFPRLPSQLAWEPFGYLGTFVFHTDTNVLCGERDESQNGF